MRIAAIGDIHCRTNTPDIVQTLIGGVEKEADVLVMTGDLTDTGKPEEMDLLLEQLREIPIPKIAVLGNHDHESDQPEVLAKMLIAEGIHYLDGDVVEIDNTGFAGTKGFCGGFGSMFVQPFGERALKNFINSSIDEAVRLENALTKLSDCQYRVIVLHYAPISATLEGEPPELFAFLGSDRLSNAIDRHGANVIFHGHAHHGSPEGRTSGQIPVHNVSRFVQSKHTETAYCLYVL